MHSRESTPGVNARHDSVTAIASSLRSSRWPGQARTGSGAAVFSACAPGAARGLDLSGHPACLPVGRSCGGTAAAARPDSIALVTVVRSLLLFAVAAVAEIGGAWLVWQGVREHRGWIWVGAGVLAMGAYGLVATLQPDANFGRILAAYGGVFVAGSLAWGVVADGFRPDRYDVIGAIVCLVGVSVIMYAPRSS